jgi:hypothetical protein
MHLASTIAGPFVADGKPYLRASVGHQINLSEFFEKVGTTLMALIPQEPLAASRRQPQSPVRCGFPLIGVGRCETLFDAFAGMNGE